MEASVDALRYQDWRWRRSLSKTIDRRAGVAHHDIGRRFFSHHICRTNSEFFLTFPTIFRLDPRTTDSVRRETEKYGSAHTQLCMPLADSGLAHWSGLRAVAHQRAFYNGDHFLALGDQ